MTKPKNIFVIFFLLSSHLLIQSGSINNHVLDIFFGNTCAVNISIAGLILARQGSKGIPGKNLVSVGGKSILGRSVETMMLLKKFSSVWVSTDGEDIAAEASKYGASVHWRASHTATDDASSMVAVQEFVHGHPEFDAIALVQCTSPFLKTEFLSEAYELLQQGFDSVFSATREYKLRWNKNLDSTLEPLNFNPARRPRRQDWSGELVENGMFYFTRKHYILKGIFQGGRMAVVEIPRHYSLEIDTYEDLNLARARKSL